MWIRLSVKYDHTWILLIATFLTGLATSSSLAIAAQSNSSANPAAVSWILEGNVIGRLIPNCSDLCLRVDDTDSSFGVVVKHCQGSSSYELWSYNAETKTIASAIASFSLCLDSTGYSESKKLHVSKCNASVAAQQWTWDKLDMSLSTVINSSTNGNYYLMGEVYSQSYWGSGINIFGAKLGSSDVVNDEQKNFTAIWSFINYTDLLPVKPWNTTELTEMSLVPDSSSNLILNGGFEICGYDPGAGFVNIATSDPLYLCGWRVVSKEVEYSYSFLWQPQEGSYSLELNAANLGEGGAVMQQVAVSAGKNYSLSFYMATNPMLTCGSTNKTMQMEVSPSSLAVQEVWYDFKTSQSENGSMMWQFMGPMGFTAYGELVNVTFRSLTDGSCGPAIDNVRMTAVDGPLPPPWKQQNASSTAVGGGDGDGRQWKRAVLLMAVCVSIVLLIITICVRMRKRRRVKDSRVASKPVSLTETTTAVAAEVDSWDVYIPLQQPVGFRHLDIAALSQHGRDEHVLALSVPGPISGDNSTAGAPVHIEEWTWRDVQRYTRDFRKLIGEGGFSRVYLGKVPAGVAHSGIDSRVADTAAVYVAVKIEKSRDRSRQIFKQELSVVSRLRHPYLVNLLGFCNEREEGILIFEYMGNGNLYNRLHPSAHESYKELSWDKRMGIARRIAWALSYLHSKARPRVLHGDVKSANVLLDNQDNAKLCDFGFARRSGVHSSAFHTVLVGPHVQGSLGYLDPEYLEHGRLSTKSDVYSFGVLLLELITGLRAFDMHRSRDLPSFAHPYLHNEDPSMSQLIVDPRLDTTNLNELMVAFHVARMCLYMSPVERPNMADVAQMLSFHLEEFKESSSNNSSRMSTPISPR